MNEAGKRYVDVNNNSVAVACADLFLETALNYFVVKIEREEGSLAASSF